MRFLLDRSIRETKELLTAKFAKKSREERREEQPEAFFAFFASSAFFLGERTAVKSFFQ